MPAFGFGVYYFFIGIFAIFSSYFAFKEFTNEPIEQRNKRHDSQQRKHSPFPATSEHRSPHHSPTRDHSPTKPDPEVAVEVDEWRLSADMRRRQNNMFDEGGSNEVDYLEGYSHSQHSEGGGGW